MLTLLWIELSSARSSSCYSVWGPKWLQSNGSGGWTSTWFHHITRFGLLCVCVRGKGGCWWILEGKAPMFKGIWRLCFCPIGQGKSHEQARDSIIRNYTRIWISECMSNGTLHTVTQKWDRTQIELGFVWLQGHITIAQWILSHYLVLFPCNFKIL